MNANELAGKMLTWGQKHAELALLTAEIETAVLELGKTQNVGNIRATYSGGRKRYDYEAAVYAFHDGIVATDPFATETITRVVDWRAYCLYDGIKDIPFTQSEPSVTVKVI